MAYEHKDGFGALFKNDKKESEKHPDYKGSIMLGGIVYELAGWKKDGSKGTFLSLKGQEPRNRESEPVETRHRNVPDAADRGDIPF
jgi:uncharacterized protein (DUF736 family)